MARCRWRTLPLVFRAETIKRSAGEKLTVFSLTIRKTSDLPTRPNAIDAAICIAAGVMTDCSARHRTRPQNDACPCDAMGGITDVFAVHDRLGWRWMESETGKPQQDSRNPGNWC
jgi:hypothetical protein